MKKSQLLGAVCAALAFISVNIHAATVVQGTAGGDGLWGFVQFTHPGGNLTIDLLANGWTGGPVGLGIGDTYITLHTDDGSPFSAFTGTKIGENDDPLNYPMNGTADGSTSPFDSWISIPGLSAGNYLLTIGYCCAAFAGDSTADSGINPPALDFQVTFSQNVTIKSVSGMPGDINFDHQVNLADYLLLTRFVLGTVTATQAERNAGDMNRDGQLDAGDLIIHVRSIL